MLPDFKFYHIVVIISTGLKYQVSELKGVPIIGVADKSATDMAILKKSALSTQDLLEPILLPITCTCAVKLISLVFGFIYCALCTFVGLFIGFFVFMDYLVESSSEFSSTKSIMTEITESSSSVANPVEAQTPRLKPVWQSPFWKFFMIAEDIKYAKCNTCNELVPRGGGSMKSFNTTNLVNHLKSKHREEFRILERIKKHNAKQQRVKEFRKDPTNWEVCANLHYRLLNKEPVSGG